jgi:hypothetical protein
MERRNFLGALTGTSLGVLVKDSFAEFAPEQNTEQAGAPVAGQGPFETSQVEVSGNTVFVRRYGKGPGRSDGARFPAYESDVAIPRAEASGESHCDLCRPARLRAQRNTRFYGRPLSLFQTRHGTGTR